MKKNILFTSLILSAAVTTHAQYVHKIKTDSLLVTNTSGGAELIIENGTRTVSGFLFNKGNGRTEFRPGIVKLTDSTYRFGTDTIKIPIKPFRRFGLEDNRAAQNRTFSGRGLYYVVIDSVLFAVKGKDSANPTLPSLLTGSNYRMSFYTLKGAIRAGNSTSNLWDHANTAYYSAAFGGNARGTGAYSFGAGGGNGQGSYAVALGSSNSTGNYATSYGISITGSGDASFTGGSSSTASSLATIGIGFTAIANDTGAIAIGYNPNANGDYSFATGFRPTVTGRYSVALGRWHYITAENSYSFGQSDTVLALSSTAIGLSNKVKNAYQTVTGRFNDTTDTKNLFAVANGYSHILRRNVFTVDTSGNTSIGVAMSSGSVLEINGSIASDIQTLTSGTTLSDIHSTILADATSGNITLTLPVASTSPGRIYVVKLISATNSVTVQRSGSDTIDGGTSVAKNTQWGILRLQSDGSNWYVTCNK